MRILILGDVVGEPGRRLMEAHLPEPRREYAMDFLGRRSLPFPGRLNAMMETFGAFM